MEFHFQVPSASFISADSQNEVSRSLIASATVIYLLAQYGQFYLSIMRHFADADYLLLQMVSSMSMHRTAPTDIIRSLVGIPLPT